MRQGSYLNKHNNPTPTQREPLDERQVKNAAGGYVYPITKWDALNRFLILGTAGGSHYETESDLTKQNLDSIIEAIKEDGVRVVNTVHEMSFSGKAKKNDQALFVLALCLTHGDIDTKHAVEHVYTNVARTGTHHFMFVNFIDNMRGWGRCVKRTVASWYDKKDQDSLAYQVLKYRTRDDWTHRRVLNRCHAGLNTGLYRYLVGEGIGTRTVVRDRDGLHTKTYPEVDKVAPRDPDQKASFYPRLLDGFKDAQMLEKMREHPENVKTLVHLIEEYGLTHEMIPNKFKNSREVWEALFEKMPVGATLRNLGKLSSLGMLDTFSDNVDKVLERFSPDNIKKARLHPLSILVAHRVYESGSGVRGSLKWSPNMKVVSHLEDAFYWSFDAIEPSGKKVLLALDTSGSMFPIWGGNPFGNCPNLYCGEVAAVMAMATARVERDYAICAFDDAFHELPITEKSSLPEVMRVITDRPHGSTDCSLPMLEAYRRGWRNIEGFAIYTDGDTWKGNVHPKQALEEYRERTGMDARLITLSMVATKTSIADGTVPYMMDFVGMSTDTPRQVSLYLAGDI